MSRMTAATVPSVPLTCPPWRFEEVNAARLAAVVDMANAEEAEATARERRKEADSALLHYENLLLEINGQGTLELA